MNLTRRRSSSLADPRQGPTSVLTVMFFVLTVLGVQAVCGVHLDEAGHSDQHMNAAVGHHATPAAADTPDQAAETAPGHHDQDPNHCSEDRTATARYDRTVSPSTDLAGVPPLAVQWPVPGIASHGPRAPSGQVAAAGPSLHALGISRT